ncbi:MAG: hypothetical protein MJ150_01510 [Clostridia bacterium]|nr:hypothetical protein [Clostridia bacterium]
MVKLLIGRKGTGKTAKMVEIANDCLREVNGSVVFINKNQRLMYDLKYRIRVVCMEEYEAITNVDEYIGFIYGIISQDHDIEKIFIDSILKHSKIEIADIPTFLAKLEEISKAKNIDFTVSLSADKEELAGIDNYEILN